MSNTEYDLDFFVWVRDKDLTEKTTTDISEWFASAEPDVELVGSDLAQCWSTVDQYGN